MLRRSYSRLLERIAECLCWVPLNEIDLLGVNLSSLDIPVIENIDRQILDAIQEEGGKLDMAEWHTCATTHCRAGWAIRLAGAQGYELENEVGPNIAGALIYAVSRPDRPIPDFFATTEDAMQDLIASASEDQ